MKKLTSTSHAILSLLAMRSWSAYELTQQMHRNVGLYWPRAERSIYDEVKNLVAHGLAEASDETHGRRPRSVYRITPRGRRALRAWLETPVAAPLQLESEALLRVAFGENGSPDALLATVAALRAQVAKQAEMMARIADQYDEGQGPYPERLHVIGMVMQFFAGHLEACEGWARWATDEVSSWTDAATPPDPDRARRIVADAGARARTAQATASGGPAAP